MYSENYLAERLSRASSGRLQAPFIEAFSEFQSSHKITYGDFWRGAEQMAAVLVSKGLKPGDRVVAQTPKSVATLELYLGCVLAGAIFVPLNTAYTPTEIRYFLNDAKPHIFVCHPEAKAALEVIAKETETSVVLTLAEDQSGTLSQLRDQVEAGFKAVARSESDIAAILYTSGTTGRSKGAMMSHAALATNAETLKDYWHFTESDVLIHGLPIFHAHGLFVAVNVTFMAGSQILFMPKFDAEHVIDLMPKATTFMGVPTHYTRLLAQPGLTNAAAGLRLCVSGSAPLSSETFKTWKAATGKAILERYGMTETNMNTSNPYEGERRAGAVGFPLPGVELKICDSKSGKELAPGETGTIEIRGPNLFSGYWRMPEKTAMEMRQDGWLITGDLGKVDADGYVHIVGRSKDLIISGGYNIYPKEVEVVLDATASVQESAVIGVPHPDFGEGVVAIVVPKMGQTPNLRSVMDEIEGKLARFKLPKRMVLADELPRNTMGKVQKNVLRERYSELLTTGSAN